MADDSQIDPSQWLPHGVPVVNSHRAAIGDIRQAEGRRGGAEVCSFAHPLDFYLKRSWVTAPQHAAGVRFCELWEIGYVRHQLAQMRYGDPGLRGNFNVGFADECRDRYDRAAMSIRGMERRDMAFNVCCIGHRAGNGKIVILRDALDDLDAHFLRNDRSS